MKVQIEDARKMLFSDTLVPDVFISEYMSGLSGTAVKVYLYALQVSRRRDPVGDGELARRLDCDIDEIRAAVLELQQKGLIEYSQQKKTFTICDVKEAELQQYYRPRTSAPPSEVVERTSQNPERDKLLCEINKSFFHGIMGYKWYQAVDEWFERYHFEPEVVYALFNECASRNKLAGPNYMAAIAADWHDSGVVTYQDLNRLSTSREKVNRIVKEVGKRLRKHMTESDEIVVKRWVQDFGYDMDVIGEALNRSVRIGNPNLEYFDSILSEWHKQKLGSLAEVIAYEETREKSRVPEKRGARKAGAEAGGRGRYQNVGNFNQREYSDDFLDQFYQTPFNESTGDAGDGRDVTELAGGETHAS